MASVELYHQDEGIYLRVNCNVDVSAANAVYIMVKNEAGTITQLTAEKDPFYVTHIRYLIPASSYPFSTEPSGKDFVEYWIRSKIVWDSTAYPDGKQGKEVLLRVGKSWAVTT